MSFSSGKQALNLCKAQILEVFFLVSFISVVNCQVVDFTVRDYQEIDGLTQNGVQCILQDSKGFMWFGTRNGGLDRFDGYNFEHHKMNPYIDGTISSNAVASLFEDKNGHIWAGLSGKGISKYNPKTKTFKNYLYSQKDSSTVAGPTVKCIEMAQDKKIWIGCWQGLCVYNEEEDNFERIKFFSKYRIINIVPIGESNVLIGTLRNGIYLIDLVSKEIIKKWKIPVKKAQINTVFQDSNGMIWCGTWKNGIYRLDSEESDDFVHINDGTKNIELDHATYVRDFHEDKNGNLWVTSAYGIFVIPSREKTREVPASLRFESNEFDRFSLSNSSALTIIEDKDGDFWSGTWRDGVNHINVKYRNFKHFQYAKDSDVNLNSPVVHDVFKHDDKLYIAVRDGGLNVYNLNSGKYNFFIDGSAADGTTKMPSWIYSIDKLSEDILVLASTDGVFFFDVNTEEFTQYFPDVVFENVKLDSKGKLWLASWRSGLWVLDVSTNKTGNYEDPEFTKIASSGRALLEDEKGRMWVSNNKFLSVYTNSLKLWKKFEIKGNDPNSLSSLPVRSFALSSENKVLMATDKGLNIFNEDSLNFTVLAEWDGLPANPIENIVVDTSGKIWITTNKGLSSFNIDFGAGNKTEMVQNLHTYTIDDGLQANSFLYKASHVDTDGVIYLGGTNGFNSFNPYKMVTNTIPPQAVVSNFLLFNKPVEIGEKDSPLDSDILYTNNITLNHKQSVFAFGFTALNYNSPEKSEYAYIMEGLDEDWNYVGTKREASFTNIPPGNYYFRVKATNNDGIWGEPSSPIKVRVKPPWYRTIVFYLMCIGLIVYFMLRFYNGRKEKAAREKKMLEDKIREGEEIVEQQKREVDKQKQEIEERDIREKSIRYMNQGLAKFSQIINARRSDMDNLLQAVISELVKYLEASAGAVYINNDEENSPAMVRKANYCYKTQKNTDAYALGEGYVGTCWRTRKTLTISNMSESHVILDSGLGSMPIDNIIFFPVILEEQVLGIIEIAFFGVLEDYKIDFTNKLIDNLGAAIAITKANNTMQQILEENNTQAEELLSQSEEMRQNIEELQATQEEWERRESKLKDDIEFWKQEANNA